MRGRDRCAHLLILGGTGEGAALAQAALARFGDGLRVTTSLAGRTARPASVAGELRIGGVRRPRGPSAPNPPGRARPAVRPAPPLPGPISAPAPPALPAAR